MNGASGTKNMKLPKGTFRALAMVIGPLLLLMSVGWFLYPSSIHNMTSSLDEIIDYAEIELFSNIMAAASIILGLILIVYWLRTPKLDETVFDTMAAQTFKCPYCTAEVPRDSAVCNRCGKDIP